MADQVQRDEVLPNPNPKQTQREAINRLVKLLSVIVAHGGGKIELPYEHVSQFPVNISLVEHYDDATDMIVLRTGVVDKNGKPAEPEPPAPQHDVKFDVLGKAIR